MHSLRDLASKIQRPKRVECLFKKNDRPHEKDEDMIAKI